MISLRLVQQGTQREALTKYSQNAKSPSIENEINTYSVSKQEVEIDTGLQISLGQNDNGKIEIERN